MGIPPGTSHFQHPNQTRHLRRNQTLVYPGINVSDSDGVSNQNAYANKNKWVATVPLHLVLGPDYQNISLRLSTFTMPSIEMGSDKVSYRGVEIETPTHMMQPGSKEITFNYFINSDWTDYRALYNWCMNNAPINKGANALDTGNVDSSGLTHACDIDVQLLSPYKKPIVGFRFKNCWIKSFSDLQLSYAEQDEIQHSFTCAYTHFVMLDLSGLEGRANSTDGLSERDQKIREFKRKAAQAFIDKYGTKSTSYGSQTI